MRDTQPAHSAKKHRLDAEAVVGHVCLKAFRTKLWEEGTQVLGECESVGMS